MKKFLSHTKLAFTLVELLLVVVILGILAGIGLVVLNPQMQIRKSQEAVLRSNMSKVCSAMTACMGGQSGSSSTANCDQVGQTEVSVVGTTGSYIIGISEPSGATYVLSTNNVGGSPANINSYVLITGTLPFGGSNCIYRCATSNNFSAQNIDGGFREPGEVYTTTPAVCLLD